MTWDARKWDGEESLAELNGFGPAVDNDDPIWIEHNVTSPKVL